MSSSRSAAAVAARDDAKQTPKYYTNTEAVASHAAEAKFFELKYHNTVKSHTRRSDANQSDHVIETLEARGVELVEDINSPTHQMYYLKSASIFRLIIEVIAQETIRFLMIDAPSPHPQVRPLKKNDRYYLLSEELKNAETLVGTNRNDIEAKTNAGLLCGLVKLSVLHYGMCNIDANLNNFLRVGNTIFSIDGEVFYADAFIKGKDTKDEKTSTLAEKYFSEIYRGKRERLSPYTRDLKILPDLLSIGYQPLHWLWKVGGGVAGGSSSNPHRRKKLTSRTIAVAAPQPRENELSKQVVTPTVSMPDTLVEKERFCGFLMLLIFSNLSEEFVNNIYNQLFLPLLKKNDAALYRTMIVDKITASQKIRLARIAEILKEEQHNFIRYLQETAAADYKSFAAKAVTYTIPDAKAPFLDSKMLYNSYKKVLAEFNVALPQEVDLPGTPAPPIAVDIKSGIETKNDVAAPASVAVAAPASAAAAATPPPLPSPIVVVPNLTLWQSYCGCCPSKCCERQKVEQNSSDDKNIGSPKKPTHATMHRSS